MIEPIIVSISASGRIPCDRLRTNEENASPTPVMAMTPMTMPEQAQAAATSMAPVPPEISAAIIFLGVILCSLSPSHEKTIIAMIDQKTAMVGE